MRHAVRMRFAHIVLYAGVAGEALKAPNRIGIVAAGDT